MIEQAHHGLRYPITLSVSQWGVRGSVADEPFGPFSVAPGSVSRLGRDFTPFVNELLRAEAADACLAGGSLVTTMLENVADGGVDASLDSAAETRYLPRGQSA